MRLGETLIVDTFAEAFRMRYARVIVTAADEHCLNDAIGEFTGYGSSVIACDAEVGLERRLATSETPDGRPGAAVLAFGFSVESLGKALLTRTGQCLLPCATTAVFNGLASSRSEDVEIEIEAVVSLGRSLRFFGDGYQKSKLIANRRYWRIPVMDGEFLVEEQLAVAKGIAGGNIIIQARTQAEALAAARRSVAAIADMPGVITPFPGGIVRSGSKVGSRYKALRASTNHAFCPTLRGRVESHLVDGAHAAYEIVINGATEAIIASAMRACTEAAVADGVLAISAGNYGGKLGKFHFKLRELLAAE